MSLIATSSAVGASLLAAEVSGGTIPMPTYVYGLIAFGLFLTLLALLWSFRNTAAKVGRRHTAPPGPHDPGHEHRWADPVDGTHN